MDKKQKLEQLENWMKLHKVDKVGDKVYDGLGVITMIDKGEFDCEIRVRPLYASHNLGNGYGNVISILF